MAQYHQGDEGLRNLRRRAPMMAVWDDHETTNVSSTPCPWNAKILDANRHPQQNAYGYGTASTVSNFSQFVNARNSSI